MPWYAWLLILVAGGFCFLAIAAVSEILSPLFFHKMKCCEDDGWWIITMHQKPGLISKLLGANEPFELQFRGNGESWYKLPEEELITFDPELTQLRSIWERQLRLNPPKAE